MPNRTEFIVRELLPSRFAGAGGAFKRQLSPGDYRAASACGAVAFLVYFATAAPTITGEDAGELASAAWTLGISHPPGYPLYMLAGKAFATLFPVGDVAYRLNVFSGMLSGLAVAVMAALCIRLAASRTAAVCAGLAAAFTPTLWSQSTIAEVYALMALFLAFLVHLTVLYLLDPSPRRLLLLAYLSGLSLAAHPILCLALPGIAAAALLRSVRTVGSPALLLLGLLFFLLGLAPYLYLPIRSVADPAFLRLLGEAYRKQKRYRNAVEAFRGAAALDPSDAESLRLAAVVAEENLKDSHKAKAFLAESLRRKPTQPEVIEKLYGKSARRQYEAQVKRVLEDMATPHVPDVPDPLEGFDHAPPGQRPHRGDQGTGYGPARLKGAHDG